MLLGRIIGTVWATCKDHSLDDLKFLVVQGIDLDGKARKDYVVAVDVVGAGVGETVLVAQGSSGRQTEQTKNRPVDAVIMAIVDDLEVVKKRSWKAFDGKAVKDLVGS